MCRGVKISGVNCKKPRFRRYFQSLPSRVYRGNDASGKQRTPSIKVDARSEARVGSRYRFEDRLECCPVSSFPPRCRWDLCRRHDQIARSDRKVCKFIRDGICYISIITSCAPRRSATINLADFCGRGTCRLRYITNPRYISMKGEQIRENFKLGRKMWRGSAKISSRRHTARSRISDLQRQSIHYCLERRAERAVFHFVQIESPGESQGRRGIMTRRCFLRKRLIDNRSRCGEITYASERASERTKLSRV